MAESLSPAQWVEIGAMPEQTVMLMRELLQRSAERIQSGNAAIWFRKEKHLVPQIGVGSHADHFLNRFEQPLNQGIVSLVLASGQSFCQNQIKDHDQHSDLLDIQLGIQTDAMIVVPIHLSGKTMGVITCVHTRLHGGTEEPQSFGPADLAEFEFLAACINHLILAGTSNDTPDQ